MKRQKCDVDGCDMDEPELEGGVSRVGCHIYFFTDVSTSSQFKFATALYETERYIEKNRTPVDPVGHVYIHINSGGGDVFAGLAMMDLLDRSKLHTHTIVEGMCASAATFILLGGEYRYMSTNSFVLIHQISSGFLGTAREWKDENKNMNLLMKRVRRIYNKKTKLGNSIDDILTHDLYISVRKAIKKGIVHSVYK
jgi:ATP-dependent protease ClpP protease subunit